MSKIKELLELLARIRDENTTDKDEDCDIKQLTNDAILEQKNRGWHQGPPPEGCKNAFARMKYDDEIYKIRWCDVIGGWKDWLGSKISADEIIFHYPLDDILKEGEGLE